MVGLLYRSEPNLILAWLACLSRRAETVDPAISDAETDASLLAGFGREHRARGRHSGDSGGRPLRGAGRRTFFRAGHRANACWVWQARVPATQYRNVFSIVQLSSGTTGYRKAVEFHHDQLARHVEDYGQALQLTQADKIASWLPLYHDMGYVACFVMPLMLGIDVVMIDPMIWVQSPGMLFDAIEQYRCTLCYMPNFGFEVMAARGPRPMPSMRRWVSCSEPVSARTSEKFLGAIGAPDHALSRVRDGGERLCRDHRDGCRTLPIDGVDVVSCGNLFRESTSRRWAAKSGFAAEARSARIWAAATCAMLTGFYATGDLGQIVEGELFVSGRKQDLLIQAGRKYVLSDIDLRVNELFPEVRGRAAALALRDERLGTEMPTVLVEAQDFFERNDSGKIAAAVKDATGLDQIEVAFVPPRFLTKDVVGQGQSSADRGQLAGCAIRARPGASRGPWAERGAGAILCRDGLGPPGQGCAGLAVADGAADHPGYDARSSFDGAQSLRDFDAGARHVSEKVAARPAQQEAGLRIVSLANRATVKKVEERHLLRLERRLGCPVSLEHVCLPPSAIVLSDLIFHDYFRPRLDNPAFSAVDRVMEQLHGASIILVDDMAELFWRYESTYPVLSHNLERDPRADLVSFRWQKYTQNHDELPLTIVTGNDIPLDTASRHHAAASEISGHADLPAWGLIEQFERYTADWDFHAYGQHDIWGMKGAELADALVQWIGQLPAPPVRKPAARWRQAWR